MAEEIITSTNRETATDHAYGGEQIQVLEGLEAVRKRPGMYIGSTGPSGLHHLVYEIVDNSIDEALAGYCNHIEVTIKEGDIIEVSDNGRGIPVGIQPKLGIPAVTVVFTVLHAGGKFGGENSGYKVSGGLHGVGASVVNALSEWLVVRVRQDGAEYEQRFRRGKPEGDLQKIGTAASTGTLVTFKPDPEMFVDTTVYDYETLLKRLREEAFLNAGVRITLTDERSQTLAENGGAPRRDTMCYEGGIRSFVSYLQQRRDLTPLHPQVIYMRGEGEGAVAGIAGMVQVSGSDRTLSTGVAGGVGFTAIIVAWLARLNPISSMIIAFLFAVLEKGSSVVQSQYNLSTDCADVLQGIILFFVLGCEFFIRYKFVRDKKQAAPEGGK